MKIKLDENLPHRLAGLLKNLGHEIHTLHEEKLSGHSDKEVWDAAQKESRFLITQDLDFSGLRKFAPGSHHGILLLRLRSPNRRALMERVKEIFEKENVSDWSACCGRHRTQDSRAEAGAEAELIRIIWFTQAR